MNDTATAHEKARILRKLQEAPMYWCTSFGYNAHALKCHYHVFSAGNPPKGQRGQPGLLFYDVHRPDLLIQLLTTSGPPFYHKMVPVNFDGTGEEDGLFGTLCIQWELIDE